MGRVIIGIIIGITLCCLIGVATVIGAVRLFDLQIQGISETVTTLRSSNAEVGQETAATTWCDLNARSAEFNGTAVGTVTKGDLIDIVGPATLHPTEKASELTSALKIMGFNPVFVPYWGVLIPDGEHLQTMAMADTIVYKYDSYNDMADLADQWKEKCSQ